MTELGPITEARFAEVYAKGALATASDAAGLLGLDVRTLRALSDDLIIRAAVVGSTRRYREADLRRYLTEGPSGECLSTSPRRAVSTSTTSSTKVVAFTARPASKRFAKPRK